MSFWLLRILTHWMGFQHRILMVLARRSPTIMERVPVTGDAASYVTADPRITPMVLMAAWTDGVGTPLRQAELNACMESLRGCERILEASQQMLGELSVVHGIPEGFTRMAANHLLLGMNLQRRLSE